MNYLDLTNYFNIPAYLIYIALVWSLIWKGIALWKAAHKNDKIWYVALLVINTVGILEILYIFVFSKKEYQNVLSNKKNQIKSNLN